MNDWSELDEHICTWLVELQKNGMSRYSCSTTDAIEFTMRIYDITMINNIVLIMKKFPKQLSVSIHLEREWIHPIWPWCKVYYINKTLKTTTIPV
jgi:hypothetical protein